MEHSLHIAAKHFVEAVAPASPTSLRKKVKAALQKAQADGDLGLGELDAVLAGVNLTQEFASMDDEDTALLDTDSDSESEDFRSGDSLGKALALVKQACSSIHSI